MCDKLNARRCDGRLALLREGLVCTFMGRSWRLLAGEVIEDALREGWHDDGGLVYGEDTFIDWVLEDERLAGFLPASLGMDSIADEFWDKLRGAIDELLEQHRHEMTVQTPGRLTDRSA